jgi:nitrogen regulatory protein P-II 1
MKQIKAYIRRDLLHDVETNLERAGFTCITLIEASAAGGLVDPEKARYSSQFVKSSEAAKIELVCGDGEVDKAISIIEKHGRRSRLGDGIIIVSPVDRAIDIRTTEEAGDSRT